MPANLSFISITQAIFLSNFVFHGPVLFVFVAFIAYDAQHRKGKMKFGEMNNSLKKKSVFSPRVLWFPFCQRGKVGCENVLQATYVSSLCTFARHLGHNKTHRNSKSSHTIS